MTREEFSVLVKALKATYTQATFIPDKDSFDVWYNLLGDLPYSVASAAVQKHMVTSEFPPTIASIRKAAVTEPEEMSELAAWALVYKAICNSNYNAEAEFDKLPDLCQRAVGNPANLREWAAMDMDTVQSVEQSHFVRSYRAAAQRKKEEAQIPERVRTLIANATAGIEEKQ